MAGELRKPAGRGRGKPTPDVAPGGDEDDSDLSSEFSSSSCPGSRDFSPEREDSG